MRGLGTTASNDGSIRLNLFISSRKSSQVAGSNPSATIRVGSLNGSWNSVWAVRPRRRSPPLYEKLASSRTTACSCSMFFQRHSRGNRIKVFSFRSDIGGLIGCFEAEHRAHGDLTGPNGYQVEKPAACESSQILVFGDMTCHSSASSCWICRCPSRPECPPSTPWSVRRR